MNRVLTFALALSTAVAHVASAQAGAPVTTKQNPNISANARAQGGASLKLSNNPVTRAYHKGAAAIGFGDSKPARLATPAQRRTVAANNQKPQSTSRSGSSALVKPVVARPASQPPTSAPVTSNPAANSKAAATPPTAMKPLAKAAATAPK